MKKPEDDVWLTEGSGYMVENDAYQVHLQSGVEFKEVSFSPHYSLKVYLLVFKKTTCNNYRADNKPSSSRKDLSSTGIGACACSRHGCFVPHSVVDFQKGERPVIQPSLLSSLMSYDVFPGR